MQLHMKPRHKSVNGSRNDDVQLAIFGGWCRQAYFEFLSTLLEAVQPAQTLLHWFSLGTCRGTESKGTIVREAQTENGCQNGVHAVVCFVFLLGRIAVL